MFLLGIEWLVLMVKFLSVVSFCLRVSGRKVRCASLQQVLPLLSLVRPSLNETLYKISPYCNHFLHCRLKNRSQLATWD
jgi:hypothetical protein